MPGAETGSPNPDSAMPPQDGVEGKKPVSGLTGVRKISELAGIA